LQTVPPNFRQLGRILLDLGAFHYLQEFEKDDEDDSRMKFLGEMGPRHIHRLFGMSEELAASFVEKCRLRLKALQDPVSDDALERGLWLKGCLVLEVCTKEAMPFVGSVMQRLHVRALENVKQNINRDLGSCEEEDWDCSKCSDADRKEFTEDTPLSLNIRALDANGVADHGAAHGLIPGKSSVCYLKNVPPDLFPESDGIAPSVPTPSMPLLLLRNPADPAETKDIKSSKFVMLRSIELSSNEQCLTPFRVTRWEPGQNASQSFNAVLCHSRPGHTKPLVESSRPGGPTLPQTKGDFAFAFWALSSSGSEIKHGLKAGDFVCFDGPGLPRDITVGHRYLVGEASKSSAWCFNVCGFIICPMAPYQRAADSSAPEFAAVRRSPIAR
jgi:hypothetical protein